MERLETSDLSHLVKIQDVLNSSTNHHVPDDPGGPHQGGRIHDMCRRYSWGRALGSGGTSARRSSGSTCPACSHTGGGSSTINNSSFPQWATRRSNISIIFKNISVVVDMLRLPECWAPVFQGTPSGLPVQA